MGSDPPFFFTLAWAHSSASHMDKPVLCPCSAFQECEALSFPPRPGAATWSCWPLGHVSVQVEMWLPCLADPAGIYRHIMPSRGQSFFPSCRNTWDPCWPSITYSDSAHSSWWFMGFPIPLLSSVYSDKAKTWKLFRSAQLVITAVSL